MKNFLWALAVVVIASGGYLLSRASKQNTGTAMPPSPAPVVSQEGTTTLSPALPGAPMVAAVTYSGSGFSPSEVTIKNGGAVTWKNASGEDMWVASAQHPSHTVYAGTSRQDHCPDTAGTAFDQCAGEAGDYSFTFDKVGTWAYHDHINAGAFGKVIVVE